MSENKYQSELDDFRKNFDFCLDKKIVLYGVGRYTATLIDGLDEFNFVGLMDKDPDKIGTEIFNIPVVSLSQAESLADVIIINTSETYWNVIFSRIENSKLPVYYKNGVRALKNTQKVSDYKFKYLSLNELEKRISNAEVVSFDFFDTLFTRALSNPRDLFRLVPIDNNLRIEAKKKLGTNYTLDELYNEIGILSGISNEKLNEQKSREIELEKRLLIPRKEIFDLFKNLISENREVYIITDMYLPIEFYEDIFSNYGVQINPNHILISNKLKLSKEDGSLWDFYKKTIVKDRTSIHIGDNYDSDVIKPRQFSIDSYHIPDNWSLLEASSLKPLLSYCCSDWDSRMLGLIASKYYENPFRDVENNGTIFISDQKEMGYIVFGPLVLSFLLWLEEEKNNNNNKQLLFLARDGYLLKEDYDFLCKIRNIESKNNYIIISRQIAAMASCVTKEDVYDYMQMPYTGTIENLFEDRLGITVRTNLNQNINDIVDVNWHIIEEKIANVRKYYLKYLNNFNIDPSDAIVDQGYYGNNQKYLSKLLDIPLSGYYFCANLSDRNSNVTNQKMKSFFQSSDDKVAADSNIYKYIIFVESFMTAPFGMVKFIDDGGNFVYADKRKNQLYFEDKIKINEGVKEFISDYCKMFSDCKISPEWKFVDKLYGLSFDGTVKYSDDNKKSFYNDNGLMNRLESSLFF